MSIKSRTITEPVFYVPNTRNWLYFGWENDRQKSLSTMGGAVYPGGANGETMGHVQPVCYTVTIDGQEYLPDETSSERRFRTRWFQAEGYLNSPVSEWNAGDTGVIIRIHHTARRMGENQFTAVLTQVTLRNTSDQEISVQLNVSAAASREVPLNAEPEKETEKWTAYCRDIPAGGEVCFDFAAAAEGTGSASLADLKALGSFEEQFAAVKNYYDDKISRMAHPVALPDKRIENFYKNSLIVMWETMVKNQRLEQIPVMTEATAGTEGNMQPWKFMPAKDGATNYIGKMGHRGKVDLDQADRVTFSIKCNPADTYDVSVIAEGYEPELASCTIHPGYDGSPITLMLDKGPLTGERTLYFLCRLREDSKTYTEYEVRGSGGNRTGYFQYNMYFSHDVPNMVEQFIRDGDIPLAKRILESIYYQVLPSEPYQWYLDTIPKFILPYALLWQVSGDEERAAYFTGERKAMLKAAAHKIEEYMTGPKKLMELSNTLDNGRDYLIVDNFTAVNGYAAYEYLAREWGWQDEAAYGAEKKESVMKAVNEVLDYIKENGGGYNWFQFTPAMACLDKGEQYRCPPYEEIKERANGIGNSLMMATFPWNAELMGVKAEGTIAQDFDKAVEYALNLNHKDSRIYDGSWGGWAGYEYGSCYNSGVGLQMLYSEKYRERTIADVDWLMDNMTAPFQWGENFRKDKPCYDWSEPGSDYEIWGIGFSRQAILESTAAVCTDGRVIIGRGIPGKWLIPGSPIVWKNIAVNHGRFFETLKITCLDRRTILLEIIGDDAEGDIVLNLPVMAGRIASASAGVIDFAAGTVRVPGNTKKLLVNLNQETDKKQEE